MNVIDEIDAERARQISAEGWTLHHDDQHIHGELAQAAMSYIQHSLRGQQDCKFLRPQFWPWDWNWWKPTNRRRDLIKAAALIVAEIERIDRAAMAAATRSTT